MVEVISEEELRIKLAKCIKAGNPLRVKAGFDPTAPDLHLGHTVLLEKLRQFQELGHKVIFLIGDFTGMIGDPSGVSDTRIALSPEKVRDNSKSYVDQVFKILDREKTEVRFNSEWMGSMSSMEFAELGSLQTVARMMERDDFKKRYKEGKDISILEFYYPLIQGFDSVKLKSDVELGGTDQKFNLLMGRTIQRKKSQESQVVMTLPLLEGLDGVRKMSKSFGNSIGITDPATEIFGKVMSISDELMIRYYELTTSEDLNKIKALHPMEAKANLAEDIIKRFYSPDESLNARKEFNRKFQKREFPENIEERILSWGKESIAIIDLISSPQAGLVESRGEAKRLVAKGAVDIDGVKITDIKAVFPVGKLFKIKVGKKRFSLVRVKSKR